MLCLTTITLTPWSDEIVYSITKAIEANCYANTKDTFLVSAGIANSIESRYAVMGGGNNENRAIDLEDMPENLDFDYSSLMGLLATNGASLQLGKNWHWDYQTVFLRLSHTNHELLHWFVAMFNGPHFPFGKKFYYKVETSNSIQIGAKPSRMAYILWLHWNDSDIHLLPNHFSEYFNIRTLAT